MQLPRGGLAQGVLLINLGTPDGVPGVGPSTEQVKVYLKQFLMDRFVVDIPFLFRWLLVTSILRKRPEQSAEAYRKIWTRNGSPLLHFHSQLVEGVKQALARRLSLDPARVQAAMRYGNPSISAAMEKLAAQGVLDVLVVPLYPQYSLAATESSVDECAQWVRKNSLAHDKPAMKLTFFPAFYEAKPFIEAFAKTASESLAGYDYEHMLFSFHGLPERQIRKTDRDGGRHCLEKHDCCEKITEANRDCYRAQSFATARALASRLGLSPDQYTVCFQSRLGRTPWIRPYTDIVYQELAERGVKRLAVMCPAFVADCLETLEEIEMRGREQFIALGGEDLRLVPSLNASPAWVEGLSEMIEDKLA